MMNKRTNLRVLLSIALIVLVIMGCNKDEDKENNNNGNNNPPLSGAITAKVDGTNWESATQAAVIKDGQITIGGFAGKGTDISIVIDNDSPGTYVLGENSDHTAIFHEGDVYYTTISDPMAGGEVIVSDINTVDSTISGSFHFDAYEIMQSGEMKSVTDGVFTDLAFTSNTGGGGGGGGGEGSMQLDVDGNTWTPAETTAASALDLIVLAGEDLDSEQYVSFLVPNTITTGTYDLPGEFTVSYVSTEGFPYFASSGTLQVTKHNTTTNEFEGTFEFEAADFSSGTISITNGSFSVTYLGQ